MKRVKVLVVSIFMLLMGWTLNPSFVSGTTIFQDDFESGLDLVGKWRQEGETGNWNVKPGHGGNFLNNDAATGITIEGLGSLVIANGTNCSDYTIVADMGYGNVINGHPSIVFRYQDQLSHYHVALGNFDDHEFYLNKIVNGVGTPLGKYKGALIGVPNLWNTFKIVVVGNSISVYVNDTLAMTANDSSLPSGEVGFGSGGGNPQDHNFDNITVEEAVPGLCSNQPPDCSEAVPTLLELWPPNHQMVSIGILGVTDPDGDPVSLTITDITQDEPVNGLGDGNTSPDGEGVGTDTASVRAERSGTRKVPATAASIRYPSSPMIVEVENARAALMSVYRTTSGLAVSASMMARHMILRNRKDRRNAKLK